MTIIQFARVVRATTTEANELSGIGNSRRRELILAGLHVDSMSAGRSAFFYDYELVGHRDARLASFSDAEQRALVHKFLELRLAREHELRTLLNRSAA